MNKIRIYGVYSILPFEDIADRHFDHACRTLDEAKADALYLDLSAAQAGYCVYHVVDGVDVSPEMYDHLFNQMSYTLR